MREIINSPMGWLLPVGMLVTWLGFGLHCFFSPDFFDGGLGWKLIQRWKKRKEERKMNKGITSETIKKLDEFCDDLYEGQYCGNGRETVLRHYTYMLDVMEDMRQQAEPIGGRYIQANDRRAVIHALDYLHACNMSRVSEIGEDDLFKELQAVADFLRQAVS